MHKIPQFVVRNRKANDRTTVIGHSVTKIDPMRGERIVIVYKAGEYNQAVAHAVRLNREAAESRIRNALAELAAATDRAKKDHPAVVRAQERLREALEMQRATS